MNEQKKYIIKIAIIVLATIAAAVVLFPQVASLGAVAKQVATAKSNIKSTEDDLKNIEKYKTELEQLKSNMQIYSLKLPPQQDFTALLEDFSRMAAANNIKVISIEPRQPVPTQSFYTEIPIFVNIRCGYHQLGRLIATLETSERIMKVTSVKITTAHDDMYNHNIILMVSTYCAL